MKTKATILIVLLLFAVQLVKATDDWDMPMAALSMEMWCSRINYYSSLDSIMTSNPEPEPKSDFETSDEYLGRLKTQYYGRQVKLFSKILNHDNSVQDSLRSLRYYSSKLDSLQKLRNSLVLQEFSRTDIVLEKGRYDIDKGVWPMTIRFSDASTEPIDFELNLDRDRSRALDQAWDSKIVTLIEQYDLRKPRLIPSSLLIFNPSTGDSIRHHFNVYQELPMSSKIYEFSPDGVFLVTNDGAEVVAYNFLNGDRISLYGDWEDGPKSFAFSSTSHFLAVLTYYHILIYDTEDNMTLVQDIGLNVLRNFDQISWSPDCRFLLGSSDNNALIALISVKPEMKLWSYSADQEKNYGALGFSSSGRVISTNIGLNDSATYATDMLRLNRTLVYRYPEIVKVSRLSDNFNIVASVDINNKLYIINVDSKKLVYTKEFSDDIQDIDFNVESRFIAIKTRNEIQVINLSDFSMHGSLQVSCSGGFSLNPEGSFLAVDKKIYRIR